MSRPRLSGSSQSAVLLGTDGDGSTLSVDFTGGSIGPFVFTRSSSATYVDSTGTVRYGPSNLIVDTPIASAPTFPWNPFTSGQGLNTLVDGVVTSNSSTVAGQNGRAFYRQTISSLGVGLRYSMSIDILSESGGESAELCLTPSNSSGVLYYLNGSNIGDGDPVGAGVLTVIWTATATSTEMRIGVGTNTASTDKIVTWTRPRMKAGSETAVEFIANTSTTTAYQGPRFTCDADTLAPEGLLFEPRATNLLQQSGDWTLSPWSRPAQITFNGTTYAVAPDGTTTAKQVTVTSGSSSSISQGITSAINRTVSVWLRAGSLTQFAIGAFDATGGTTWGNNADSTCRIISGPGSVSQAVGGLWNVTGLSTTAWTRVQVVRTTAFGAFLIYPGGVGSVTGTGFVWGMQMEDGLGASSLIPTGSSQQTRLADSAVINDITPLNFSETNGTIAWTGKINKQPTSYITLVGFMTATDQPSYETFGNALNWFSAARGPSLSTGGANEVSRPYTLGSLIRYASSVNTLVDPIIAVNLNGSAGSINKSGTGNLRVATRFVIGRLPTASYELNYPSITLRKIQYWPVTKTAAELAALNA